MSTRIISEKRYLCTCEIPDCPRNGKPWKTKDFRIPPRCPGCGSYRWNGVDRRRKDDADSKPKKR